MKPFLILSLVGTLASPIAAAATLSTKAQDVEEEKPRDFIGVATMNDDGTIVLRLRTKSPHGGVGEGTLVYPPTHPEYQNISLAHRTDSKGSNRPCKALAGLGDLYGAVTLLRAAKALAIRYDPHKLPAL